MLLAILSMLSLPMQWPHGSMTGGLSAVVCGVGGEWVTMEGAMVIDFVAVL